MRPLFTKGSGRTFYSILAGVLLLFLVALAFNFATIRLPGLSSAIDEQQQTAAAIGALTDRFTTNGSFTWVAPADVTQVSALVVGGGGGGGSGQGLPYDCHTGNGGGSGGQTTQTVAVVPGQSYTVVVGAGGPGAGVPGGQFGMQNGGAGGSSSFNGISATGGSGPTAGSPNGVGGQGGGYTAGIDRYSSAGGNNGSGYGTGGNGTSCGAAGNVGGKGAVLITYNKTFDTSAAASPTTVLQGAASTVTWSVSDPSVVPGSPSPTFTSSGNVINNFVATAPAQPGNGYTYYYGGRNSSGASTNIIYRAPITNPTAVVDTGARLPVALRGVTALVASDGYIYLYGGFSSVAVNTIYRAPVNNPTAVVNTGTVLPNTMAFGQIAIPGDGFMYMIGVGSVNRNIWRASVSNPTVWTDPGPILPNGKTTSPPTLVSMSGTGNVVRGTDGYYYYFGGIGTTYYRYYSGSAVVRDSAFEPKIYRAPASNLLSWSYAGDMPTPTSGVGIAQFTTVTPGDGYLYLVGGYSQTSTQTWNGSAWSGYQYTITTYNTIYRAPLYNPMGLVLYGTLPAPRSDMIVATTSSAMYAFGGRTLTGNSANATLTNYTNIYSSPLASACSMSGPGITSTAPSGSQSTGALSTLGANIYNLVCNVGSGFTATASSTVMVYANAVLADSSDTAAAEPSSTASFTIGRTGSTAAALPVAVTLGGSATYNTDYTLSSGSQTSVTIPAGSASTTVTVTPINDSFVESNETAVLTIGLGSYTIGASPWNTRTVTIADDDTTPPIPVATETLQASCVSGGTMASECRVRAGNRPYLSWDVSNIGTGQSCAITSSDSAQTGLPSQAGSAGGATFSQANYQVPAPITGQTTFTLTCTGIASSQVTIMLVPVYEEI